MKPQYRGRAADIVLKSEVRRVDRRPVGQSLPSDKRAAVSIGVDREAVGGVVAEQLDRTTSKIDMQEPAIIGNADAAGRNAGKVDRVGERKARNRTGEVHGIGKHQ